MRSSVIVWPMSWDLFWSSDGIQKIFLAPSVYSIRKSERSHRLSSNSCKSCLQLIHAMYLRTFQNSVAVDFISACALLQEIKEEKDQELNSHPLRLSESSKRGSSSTISPASSQNQFPKALQRYNSVKAVAEANQARVPGRQHYSHSAARSRSAMCQTTPAEFTSAEVGVLGANVAQLNSAPDVWFSAVAQQSKLSEAGSSPVNTRRRQAQEADPVMSRWDFQAAESLSHAALQHGRQYPSMHNTGRSFREPSEDYRPGLDHLRSSTRWEDRDLMLSANHQEYAELQERIDRANAVELQSSHAYQAQDSWPRTVKDNSHADLIPAQPASPFQGEFSPLQSSTMELQARYWPKGLKQFTSFKAQQHAQMSPQPATARQWSSAVKEPLRESATSADPMLDAKDGYDSPHDIFLAYRLTSDFPG